MMPASATQGDHKQCVY